MNFPQNLHAPRIPNVPTVPIVANLNALDAIFNPNLRRSAVGIPPILSPSTFPPLLLLPTSSSNFSVGFLYPIYAPAKNGIEETNNTLAGFFHISNPIQTKYKTVEVCVVVVFLLEIELVGLSTVVEDDDDDVIDRFFLLKKEKIISFIIPDRHLRKNTNVDKPPIRP